MRTATGVPVIPGNKGVSSAMWWEKKMPLVGAVLFRGEMPLRPEDFSFLETHGVSIGAAPNNTRQVWALRLAHPVWGKAELAFNIDGQLPPRELFQYALMPKIERDAAMSAGTMLMLRCDTAAGHVLRDRKLMLRYLRAVMADDGVVALDCAATNVWTRDSLDDELRHDADLDVEAIYGIHAVSDDEDKRCWVHSHGLAAVGGFDFDLFGASPAVLSGIQDLFRALAFHILEGSLTASASRFRLMNPNGDIRMVEMEHFLKNVDPSRRAKLDSLVDESHRQGRSVLCEPEKSGLGGLFRGKKLEPVRFLTGELPDNPTFGFSTPATNLMAERARGTYAMLRELSSEFADFSFPCILKLGCRVDGGKDHEREHMWFQAHELFEDGVDATLMNQPYAVSGMKQGDRGRHPIDIITDWGMMTPAGTITPRSLHAARIVRADPERIRKIIEDSE